MMSFSHPRDHADPVRRPFRLRCVGPLMLVRADGEDCTPRNAKTCGLLALLARAPGYRRPRRWLEGKLWSDRAPQQANGSLRQALAELRAALDPHRDALVSDRRHVALDPEVIAVHAMPDSDQDRRDLFEGLVVKDPEFDIWLTVERRRFAISSLTMTAPGWTPGATATPDLEARFSVAIKPASDPLAQSIANQVTQNLSELSLARLVADGFAGPGSTDLTFVTHVVTLEGTPHVSSQLIGGDGTILWTGARQVRGTIERDILEIASEATEAVLRTMRHLSNSDPSEKLRERALDELFSFDATRLRTAESLLAAAFDIRPDPLTLAWRAFVRMVMVNEGTEDTTDVLRDEACEMARLALESGSDNPVLLALISQVNLFLGIDLDGLELLARRGAERNPGAAMARMSLGTLALRAGRIDDARAFGTQALHLSGQGRLAHWSHMLCCLVEMSDGNLDAASLHAESAIALAPGYRPPKRHLYALDLKAGRTGRARSLLTRLRAEDPDFSLRMIRETPDYPAATLRASGLLHLRDIE